MINYTNPRLPAQRRPLRSLNENVALLRSPGPLESMLKTTTETGDIGIFSIRPNSSSASFRPRRSRSHPREADLLLPARSSRYDENYYCHPDDHKRLRSYRDTTSEIISLYGSESQQTLVSSVSPASLEDDHRSYSMTTTSSKRIPSQKSTGTLQSQSSGSGLQRPRSPFPYPTRLKRPGVRPASPALRENGDIDYSRMVELDRFSQRTIHGSYKPTYAHGSRRPAPLSLRPDVNRSTSSLPSRALRSPYSYAPGPYQIRAPNSSMTWAPRQSSQHQRGSIDQSTRSASLTSIVEMYDRPVTSNANCAPIQSPGSFYYDYSEQFEDQPPWALDLDVPLHPIPKRAENIRRSLLLMDDIQGSFDISDNDSGSVKSNVQDAEKDLIEPSDLSGDGDGNSEGPEANQSSCRDKDSAMDPSSSKSNPNKVPLISISDEDQNRPLNLSNGVLPNKDVDTIDMLSMMSDSDSKESASLETPSKILEDNFDVAGDIRSHQSSQAAVSKLRYSLDPALSDFASILSSFDRLGRVLTPKHSEVQSTSGGSHDNSSYQQDEVGLATLKRLSRRSPLSLPDKVGAEEGTYQKCHRRNIAAMRISTTGVISDDIVRNSPGRQDDLPILSPEPISPVRELRVKESIPQLMKALPPLPREAEKLSGYGTAGITSLSGYLAHGPLPPGKDELSAASVSGCSHVIQPRFKVKVRASPSSPCRAGETAYSTTNKRPTYDDGHDYGYSPAARPKLKLKMSGSQLSQVRLNQSELTPYNNRLKQCNSLAELASCPRKQTTDEHVDFTLGKKKRSSSPNSISNSSVTSGPKPLRFEPSPQPSDQFNIPYPPSPVEVKAHSNLTPSINMEVSIETTNRNWPDSSPSGPQGLRGKFSMLRLRFVSPQRSTSMSKESRSAPCSNTNRLLALPTAANKNNNAIDDAGARGNDQLSPLEPGKAEWRVKRWVRDARKAVRSYMKKKLDRPSKESS
ncbi:hypothetical protein TARUN_6130 [Trichoderma arundinaceum]|uniref:Uncharacterized protein n=1 Tax=Trichoderma arundinaceum TaxID=490622 RepID=A0A395NJN3_TRIAR|nr:hypothetical protein TARUN_6130 [Trichoderma arundinaceum]